MPAEVTQPEDFVKIVDFLTENSLIPETLAKNKSHAFMALKTCHALGFTTFGAMQLAVKNMYVVKGAIELWGNLPLSLVQRTGLLEDIDEFFVDEEGERICSKNKNLVQIPVACVCRVKRKGGEGWKEFAVTKGDLELSGGKALEDGGWLFTKGKDKTASTTWKKYPKIHWMYRTRALALRSLFADCLKNVAIHEHEGMKSGMIDAEGQKTEKTAQTPSISEKYAKKDLNEGNMQAKLEPPTITQKEG